MSQKQPLWYKNAVFYQINVRAFFDSNQDGHGNLGGVTQKLDYLEHLGVTCLWIMPFYPSPLRDDGYDISDFYNIQEQYGNLDEFRTLIDAAHKRGIRIIMDMVMNHTSDQHDWFQQARADRNSPYRDFYVWSETKEKYQEARIIFLDTEESNWSWDDQAGQFYWHRFYATQPDLNYDNPRVRETMLDVMRFWLKIGIDGFRADAVPYLFEREGTNCENLPETHAFLKEIRALLDQEYPDCILLAEANQWPQEVCEYFGNGDEFHMGFHFPVMPRIFMALKNADRTSIQWILDQTPAIPENCQWCTFLRNHDELTLEMVTEEERQWMWQEYAPDPRMRLNLGIRRRLAPLLENDQRKIRLANALLFSLPGAPIIYYGDEIGMGDNIWLFDRNGVRTPMQWDAGVNAGFSQAAPDKLYAPIIQHAPYGPDQVNVASQVSDHNSLLNFIRLLVKLRKQHHAFGFGNLQWCTLTNLSVLAFKRTYQNRTIVVLNNLSDSDQTVHLQESELYGTPVDLISQEQKAAFKDGEIQLTLSAYQFLWLRYQRKNRY